MTLKGQFEEIVGIRDRNCRGTAIQLVFSTLAMLALMQALARSAAQTLPTDPLGEFPVSATLCNDMKVRNVLHTKAPVGCARLKLIRFEHLGFDGRIHRGEIMVMDAAGNQVSLLLQRLLARNFPIERARLMNYYNGDDDRAQADNNTSGFNHRNVEGSNALSLHAYGLAIDVNPKQNPYVRQNPSGMLLSLVPASSINYVSRRRSFADPRLGTAESVIDLFAEHGFSIWGGRWRHEVDYQHFAVRRDLALRLARLPPDDARHLFEDNVQKYVSCRQQGRSRSSCSSAE